MASAILLRERSRLASDMRESREGSADMNEEVYGKNPQWKKIGREKKSGFGKKSGFVEKRYESCCRMGKNLKDVREIIRYIHFENHMRVFDSFHKKSNE